MSENIEVGKTAKFKDGVMKEFLAEGHEVLVVRIGDDYYAADAHCPHMKARLSLGKLEGTVVVCPFHGSKFDLKDGRVLNWVGMGGLALKTAALFRLPKRLGIYKVEIEDDSVFVDVQPDV